MNYDEFSKRQRIDRVYTYLETRMEGNNVECGWVGANLIPIDGPIVLSYPSKSKFISDNDIEWSKKEGKNATTLLDNQRYFKALTGYSPEEFLSSWSSNIESFSSIWRDRNPKAREDEEGFLLSLANLLVNGKGFSKYGRVYRLIDSPLEK